MAIGAASRTLWLTDSHYRAFLTYTPLIYSLLWVVGLGGMYWLLATVPAVLYLLNRPLAPGAGLALIIGIALTISIPIGVIAFGQPGRALAAVGNAVIWVCVASYLVFLHQDRGAIWPRVDRARMVVYLGAFQGLVVLLGFIAYPGTSPLPLTLIPAEALPSGLGTFASTSIVYDDWLGQEALRTIGVMANPTWAGAVAVVVLAAALYLWSAKTSRFAAVIAGVGAIATISLSLSRSVMLLGVFSSLVAAIVAVRRRSHRWAIIISLVGVSAVVIFILFNWTNVVDTVLSLNSERAGSWESRSDIYTASVEGIRRHPFILLGYGIKPQLAGLVASVATHSTPLSLLFRGGILGAVPFLILGILLVRQCWKRTDILGTFVIAFIFTWAMLEDLDGGHLLLLGVLLIDTAQSPGPRSLLLSRPKDAFYTRSHAPVDAGPRKAL